GRQLHKAAACGIRQPVAVDKRDVGSSDRVRVSKQREPGLGAEQLSRGGSLDVGPESAGELRNHSAVVVAGGLADDEYAADQLGALVGDAGVKQFVGGHDRGRHVVETRMVARCVNGYSTRRARFFGTDRTRVKQILLRRDAGAATSASPRVDIAACVTLGCTAG